MAKNYIIQRYYKETGWEAEEFCRSYEEAREMLHEFKEEEPSARFRIAPRAERNIEPEYINYTPEDERILRLCDELGF